MADINITHENDPKYQDFESFDVETKKDRLRKSSERLKIVIDEQVDELKKDAAAWGKAIAVVGGGVYISWKILKFFFRSGKEARKERRLVSKIVKAQRYASRPGYGRALPVLKKDEKGWSLNSFIKQQLIALIIAMAKRKLVSLITGK